MKHVPTKPTRLMGAYETLNQPPDFMAWWEALNKASVEFGGRDVPFGAARDYFKAGLDPREAASREFHYMAAKRDV